MSEKRERKPGIDVIWEWWKTRTQEEKDEAILVLEALSDNDSVPRAWLQIMVEYYGSQYVVKAIELFESGTFQPRKETKT